MQITVWMHLNVIQAFLVLFSIAVIIVKTINSKMHFKADVNKEIEGMMT